MNLNSTTNISNGEKIEFIIYNKKEIDEGSFGKIFLARKVGGIDHGKIYAVKIVHTQMDTTPKELRRNCLNELYVFKQVHEAPFLLSLKYACKTQIGYNFFMNYIPNGTLYQQLDRERDRRFAVSTAKICSAEIVSAIEFLHERHIVYRDLKLENILIDKDGHLLLTDFGLAGIIKNNGKLYDEAGTLLYFPPEIINGDKGHSYEVDWWSLGIIITELLVGYTPFQNSADEIPTEQELRSRILNQQPNMNEVRRITNFIPVVENFICSLLVKNPKKRLGFGPNGFKSVKHHQFFGELNWTAVKLKKYDCIMAKIPSRDISIDYNYQCKISIEKKNLKDFFYVAPDLQQIKQNNYIYGATPDDLQVMAKKIKLPDPIANIDIQLTDSLFLRTTSFDEAMRTLKNLLPKCSNTASPTPKISPRMASMKKHQFQPYPTSYTTRSKTK